MGDEPGAEAPDELVLDAPAAAEEPLMLDEPAQGGSGPADLTGDAPASARPSGGGTLFERMSRLSRGNAAKPEGEDGEEGEGGVDIPRFLNRQNNQ
jgi:cell division protein FtsZ